MPAACVPQRQHLNCLVKDLIVEVISGAPESDSPHAFESLVERWSAKTGLHRDELEGSLQLFAKEIGRRGPMLVPPGRRGTNLLPSGRRNLEPERQELRLELAKKLPAVDPFTASELFYGLG